MSVKVTNPNAGPVTIESVTGNSSITSSNPSGCSETNVAFPPQTGLSLGPIPAGGTMVITVPNSVHLDADAPTTCQGVLLTIPVLVTGSLYGLVRGGPSTLQDVGGREPARVDRHVHIVGRW